MTDFYEILEVEKTATEDEIKRAYRRLALKWHPDKNLTNKIEAEEKFKLISEAYEILSDKEKRRKYDHLGRAGLSNGNSGYGGFSSSHGGYGQFSEDFLNRTFHFHNPFEIFEQFMSHFGMEDDFGFGSSPFADLHHHIHRHRVTPQNSSSSRRTANNNPHRQQMALFDNFFSPMRMSVFDHHRDPFDMFAGSFGNGHGIDSTISSFNFSTGGGGGGARPVARKTTKSTRVVNGRRIVTTRIEENGQTTEVIEEDGQVTSRKINGIAQAIK